MNSYAFEDISDDLPFMPLAARRAADLSGCKPSLEAWRSLSETERRAIAAHGTRPSVDAAAVKSLLSRATPAPEAIAPSADLPAVAAPAELTEALGPSQPIPPAVWSALSALDRYALGKLARKPNPERLAAAYAEIVGQSAEVTHLDAQGQARMVAVSEKVPSVRRAVATSRVSMSAEAFARLERADAPKGDVLGTARLAGIMGAKRTPDLVPLCHPLALTRVDVTLELDRGAHAVNIRASVEAFDRTGVEMEALTSASCAALTVYDMLKAFDRGMTIGPTQLLEKSGGRSGDFSRADGVQGQGSGVASSGERFQISDSPIHAETALALVARPDAGGSVVFVGTVRDHNADGSVTLLEYEAYAEMAKKELERLAEEIERELPNVRLAALHRSGALRVGEIAVVCAASAPHRDEAFRAARALIDRLKERVPIWKREHGKEGPYWVGWQDARTGPGGS